MFRKISTLCAVALLALAIPFQATASDTLNTTRFNELARAALVYLNTNLDSMYWAVIEAEKLTRDYPNSQQFAISQVMLGEYNNRKSQYDSAMVYFHKAHGAYLRAQDTVGAARCLIRIAQTHQWKGNQAEALQLHQQALIALKELNDSLGLAGEHQSVGYIYINLGQYTKGVQNYLKAQAYYNGMGMESDVASTLSSLALAYRQLGESENEVNALERAFEIASRGQDSLLMGIVCCNLGETYTNSNKAEKGLKLLARSERLFKQLEHWGTLRSTYNAYASYYGLLTSENPQLAIEYCEKSKALAERVNSQDGIAEAEVLLGKIYAHQAQFAKAESALKQAFDRAKSHGLLQFASSSANELHKLYTQQAKHAQALEFYKTHTAYQDSISGAAKLQELKEVELSHEFEQKHLADSLRALRDQQALELSHQKELAAEAQQAYILYSVLAILLVAALFVVAGLRRSRKQAAALATKNTQIEKALDERNVLLKEIHHRVKNNLQLVSSLLQLQSRDIDNEVALAAMNEGQNRMKAIALIHQKLYQTENLAAINAQEYFEQLVAQNLQLYQGKERPETTVQAENISLDIDTAVPLGLAANELITNAMKYAFPNTSAPNLSLELTTKGNGLYTLTISDNGPGLPQNINPSRARSLGLRMVNRLAEQLFGTVDYHSENGSRIVINFKDTAARKQED